MRVENEKKREKESRVNREQLGDGGVRGEGEVNGIGGVKNGRPFEWSKKNAFVTAQSIHTFCLQNVWDGKLGFTVEMEKKNT